jgi:SAM-dependent methyltransferase
MRQGCACCEFVPHGQASVELRSRIARTAARGSVYDRWVAWAISRSAENSEELFASYRRSVLSGLEGTVVEIGPGSGVNLRYAKSMARWIGVEPNPVMRDIAGREARRLARGFEMRAGVAECLPLQEQTVEGVVSTFVLCSVRDVQGTLREVLRVLKPGGTFRFIEHVGARRGTWLRCVQAAVTPFWRMLAGGCHLDRELGGQVERAGFESVRYETVVLPLRFPLMRRHVAGVATKGKGKGESR